MKDIAFSMSGFETTGHHRPKKEFHIKIDSKWTKDKQKTVKLIEKKDLEENLQWAKTSQT